jgi:uncharacterized protein
MLTIALPRLEREGRLEILGAIPSDDPSWEGTDLRFLAPLSVSGEVLLTGSGQVLARIQVEGSLAMECRRCLEPLVVPLAERLELLFSPADEMDEGGAEGARPLPVGEAELNLKEAIREEVILSQSLLVLCKPDCKGLCPLCGANLNEERCECSLEEADPRWDALRALNQERE